MDALRPEGDAVRRLYPDAYYGTPGRKCRPPIEGLVRFVGARHIRFLSTGLSPGARVLNAGCGRGVILGSLADRGFEVHGVETSREATRSADPRARFRIAEDLATAGYPDAHFDLVVVWHVLEHLRDPRATRKEIRRVLRPGGKLIVAVPNFSSWQARWSDAAWFRLDLPRHLHHFPLAARQRLLGDTGFDLVS